MGPTAVASGDGCLARVERRPNHISISVNPGNNARYEAYLGKCVELRSLRGLRKVVSTITACERLLVLLDMDLLKRSY
jgi:hypothetical protein